MKTAFIHQEVFKRFVILGKNERLAHAYLFVGAKESGKLSTALSLAKWVNCERNEKLAKNESCDQCPSCVKANSSNHPDIHLVEKIDGEFIKIEQIRDVLDQVKLRPFLGRKKVFIIRDIECLSEEGGNALLKTLEEPSLNSLLILTTSAPDKVLDTIKSRCHIIPFLPASREDIKNYLIKNNRENALKADVLAQCSQGSLGKAQRLQEENFIKYRDEVLDRFVFASWNEAFVKETLADKIKTREFLDVLLGWVRDAFFLKSGASKDKVIHQDRIEDLKRFEKKMSFEDLSQLNDDIINMYKLLTENLNIKMPLLMIKERLHG